MFQEFRTINPVMAFQWLGEEVPGFTRSGNALVMTEMPVQAGPKSVGTPASLIPVRNDYYLSVSTVAGQRVARIGDYVVQDHLGQYHVMKADEFESQYVRVETEPTFDKAPEL